MSSIPLPDDPSPDELRVVREALNLSISEMAAALGFHLPNGERTVRRWESDPEFKPTATAWTAMRYLVAVISLYQLVRSPTDKEMLERVYPLALVGLLSSTKTRDAYFERPD